MGDMNFSLTTFNKTGKLLQIEYALNRVQQGKMSLGITATNGVVIATDKKVSSVLVDDAEYVKIQNITPSTGNVNYLLLYCLSFLMFFPPPLNPHS
jgi:20S proteasome subunit alpha 2